MNKIIRNYPVDSLPVDMQEGLPRHGTVEIEIREIDVAKPHVGLADLVGTVPNVHGTEEDVIRHIRQLRGDE